MNDTTTLTVSLTRAGAHQAARRLQGFLSEGGERFKLCNAYEGLARALGYRNWNTLVAAFDAPGAAGPALPPPLIAPLPATPLGTPLATQCLPRFDVGGERYAGNRDAALLSDLLPAEHGLVIGPTGTGKSVLFALLGLLARRDADARCVYIDRYQGLRIPVLAQGGSWHEAPAIAPCCDAGPVCVDVTEMFGRDQERLGPILESVAGLVRRAARKGILFIDEAEPMLRSPTFQAFFKGMLAEGAPPTVIASFQRPDALRTAEGAALAFARSDTFYLLPNPGGQASDYDLFGLSDAELAFVTGRAGIPLCRHAALVRRRTRGSFLLDFDLASLGHGVRAFSSSVADLKTLDEVLGRGATDWLPRFLKRGRA